MGSNVLKECLENFAIFPHNAKVENVEEVKRKNAKLFAKTVVQSLHNVHLKIPKILNSPVLENVHSKMLKKKAFKRLFVVIARNEQTAVFKFRGAKTVTTISSLTPKDDGK